MGVFLVSKGRETLLTLYEFLLVNLIEYLIYFIIGTIPFFSLTKVKNNIINVQCLSLSISLHNILYCFFTSYNHV
jgi:hypothetical protein